MRILILSDRIPPENKGGAEKVTWAIARGLQNNGHDVHVIAATEKSPFNEKREGIPTYHVHVKYPKRFTPYFSLYNPQVSGALKKLYRQIQPDVVSAFNIHNDLTYYSLLLAHRMGFATTLHSQDVMAFSYTKLTHFIDPDVCGVRSPQDYRLPRFYNLKTMRFRFNPFRNLFIRYVLNNAVQVRVAGSEAHRQSLEANGLTGFRVIHASIVPEDLDARPTVIEALRQRLNLQDRKVILFAGRLTREKGSHQVLDMLTQLIRRVPDAILLMLTRASLESQGLAAYPHLMEHVCTGGWLQGEELAAAYHLADVVVVPSICMDTFPTINLEAMAAGIPVVATCYGGSPEAVVDGETGFIVNPFDIDDFTAKVERILSDDNLRDRFGQAGRERLLTQFTLALQVEKIEQVYHEALKTR